MTAERIDGSTATHAERDGHWLNGERVRVYSWLVVVIFGVGMIAWTALSLPDLVDPQGKPVGYDFIAFWSAARLALAGRPEAAYDWQAIAAAHRLAVPALHDIVFAWHYPPTFLLAVVPFGLLAYPAALAAFVGSTAALWAALVGRIVADRRAWIVAASAPAGLINLLDGQNGFLTAALAGFALLLLSQRRRLVAGALIGLLAIKPHLALLFPLALVADRQWRAITAAAAIGAALTAASIAAFGWTTFAAFLHDLPISRALIDHAAIPWGAMPSPYVFVLSLGASPSAATALQAAVALFAAGCTWRVWRRRDAPFAAKAATLLTASLLVPPFLFTYDMTWAALAAGWLALLGWRGGFLRGEREILLFAWLAPAAMSPVHVLTSVQLGFPALLLLLVTAVRRAAPPSGAERRRVRHIVDALRHAPWLTRERLTRWGIGFAIASVGVVAVWIVQHTARGLTAVNGEQLGDDFVNYFAGARLAIAGLAGHAYDVPWFYAFEQTITGAGSAFKFYGYPPIAMLLSVPLALFSYVPALILWTAAGFGICASLLARIVGWRAAALAMIGAPAALLNLIGGQNGCFTAALLGGGLMILDRQPVLAGICFGCLGYKPQMAVLLPVALAAGGRWRAFAATGVTVALLAAASLLLFGTTPWAAFLDQMAVQRHLLEAADSFWHRMPTVFAAFRLAGLPIPFAYFAQLLSSAGAVAAAVVVWRSPAAAPVKAAGLVIATFLATPYAWDYDAVVLIFAAAWLGQEGLHRGFLPWERLSIAALLVLPLPAVVMGTLLHLQPGPVVLSLGLALLVRHAVGSPLVPAREPVSGAMLHRDSLVA